MTVPLISPQRELDAILRNDFVAFVEKCFRHLNPGRRFVPSWYIRAMAYYVWVVAIDRQVDRLLINLPPRALKSTMVSVALPAFLLGRDPTQRIVVACYSQELSNMFGRQTRSIKQADWYRRLFPSTRLNPRRTAEHDFHTTRGGFRFATSTGGTFTGRGGDLIIVDDPLKADNAYSETRRKGSVEWTKTTLFNRLDNKRDGAIIVAQQRLHPDDLSGHLIEAGGWLHLSLPAIGQIDETIQLGLGQDRYFRKAGEALDPEREPLDVLAQTRRDVGTAIFAAQYLQNPTPADGDVIRMGWFQRYSRLPEDGTVVISIDTAYKPGEHNDYSCCTVWRVAGARFYLEYVWRRQVDYPTLKRIIAEIAETFRPNAIVIEDKVSGQSLIQELREAAKGLPVIAYQPTGDKETRMRVQVAKIEAELVYLPHEASWLADYEEEMRQFPHGRNDDQVDATSQFWITPPAGQQSFSSAPMAEDSAINLASHLTERFRRARSQRLHAAQQAHSQRNGACER